LPVVIIVLGMPDGAFTELRPIVREMLENLGSVDAIGLAVATEDYEKAEAAARDLKIRARKLKGWDLAELGLDPEHDGQFDAYLALQEASADAISKAAKQNDARAVFRGVRRLFENACLPCHHVFRERSGLFRPSVVFMTSFIAAWKDINRGLAVNDFSLIGRSARGLAAMARVLSLDAVIQSTFGLSEPAKRKSFREHLQPVIAAADRVEDAATRGEANKVTEAVLQMWDTGCLSCHEEFR
jgi:cytochrome c556